MGDSFKPRPPGVGRPSAAAWIAAALPFALGWSIAAGALDAQLAPPSLEEQRFEQGPAPPSSPPATHHDDLVYDASELISV
ncbi:MAG TPA: hypothetical protein VGI39_05565 [Polyangiaceae bacterium]|jgi:hypothetical protein